MTSLISIKKKISKEILKISVIDQSKLFAEFLNVLVIQIDEGYSYES